MTRYAQNTNVSVEKSKAEIESILMRYGANGFMSAWHGNKASIAFILNNRQIKFILPLPDQEDDQFKYTEVHRHARSQESAVKAWEQACRQRWRALCLSIKAKLEAVECGITTFEEEFLAHIVLPNGQTVGTLMTPQIQKSYETGGMPPLLGAGE